MTHWNINMKSKYYGLVDLNCEFIAQKAKKDAYNISYQYMLIVKHCVCKYEIII